MLKVIVLEDEIHTRDALIFLIKKANLNLDIIGHAGTLQEARTLLTSCDFDILVTDINLSDGNIFSVLEEIPIRFQIIYSTAHEEYSLKAIKTGSLTDYILKPIDFNELKKALSNAIARIDKKIANPQTDNNKIIISTLNEYRILKAAEIRYCKSEGSYCEFHMQNEEKVVTSKPLNNYKDLLTSFGFIQTHRSHIINPQHVIGYNKEQNEINLEGNVNIPLSRRKKNDILKALFSIQ